MKVLITGHKGFIGKNLSKKFNSFFGIDENYTKSELELKLDSIQPSVIFHVGACSDTQNKDVNYMMEKNYFSTKWIVDWCLKNNCKIIYSSSASVYGVNGNFPSNLYGLSKYLADDYVVRNGGISLRYFNVYGPGEEHKGKMASMIYQNFKKEDIHLFLNKPKRDFVYVDDVVDANLYALENYENLKGNWFDVGTSKSTTFEKVFSLLENYNIKYLDIGEIPEGYQFKTKSNKKNWLPGWKPKYTLKKGINKYKKYLNEKS